MSSVYKHASYEFNVIEEIGGGGFGKVFSVFLPGCEFKYALKIFNPSSNISEASCFNDGELESRFIHEMKSQADCRHSNIASICAFNASDRPFFVMDIADCDLKTAIENDILSASEKIKVVLDVMSGLEYLHNRGWVHRDIKPANILRFGDTYKISDFGLIKDIGQNNNTQIMTAIGVVLGTKGYMAPEVLLACDYSFVSDIYALGVVMGEMNIDGFASIVDKCTMHRPIARYPSIAELRADVLKVIK